MPASFLGSIFDDGWCVMRMGGGRVRNIDLMVNDQKWSKMIKNQWKSMKFHDFHWFSLIFGYFLLFTMRSMLLTRSPPTRMTHHPSSNIAPRNETGKRSDKYWIYLWNVPYYMVLSWISGIFRIFMDLPFFYTLFIMIFIH